MIMRALGFVVLAAIVLAGAPSADAQSGGAWILWEKTSTTKATAAPTTTWEPVSYTHLTLPTNREV